MLGLFALVTALIFALTAIFFVAAKTMPYFMETASSFECGFNSTFESRFSFSIHYYIIGLIFLLLDMELCLLLPFFLFSSHSAISLNLIFIFVISLLGGLIMEWRSGKLDWAY